MRDEHRAFRARNARVVVVGNGQPHHAQAFAQEESIPFTLWVDPEMVAYRAAGLRRGLGAVFSRRSIKHAARAMRAGFRQTRTRGDPWQNGGVFVITPDGRLLMEQRSQESGDHAPVADILRALEDAPA